MARLRILLPLMVAIVLVSAPLASAATISGLSNTGVDVLPADGYDDNFRVVSTPLGPTDVPAYIVDGIWPESGGPWVDNSFLSRWIAPSDNVGTDGRLTHPTGEYIYENTFSVIDDGMGPVNVTLSGLWSSDNQALDIYLDGAPLSVLITPAETAERTFEALHAFSASFTIGSGYMADFGPHALQFVVNNLPVSGEGIGEIRNGNPTGLRVQYDLGQISQVPVPEPASMLLWGTLGLAAVGARRFRRSRNNNK